MSGITTLRTPAEVRDYAERRAQSLTGAPLEDALTMLDRGELDGTRAAVELRTLRDALPAPRVDAARGRIMRFGSRVIIARGSAARPSGEPGSAREVPGVLVGAHGHQRRVRLLADDPLDTAGWGRAGDTGEWPASAVRPAE